MKRIRVCSIFILIIFTTACSKKAERKFYDTGQVKEERVYDERNDTAKYFVTYYYLNGQIISKGNVVDGSKNGNWQEWYANGSIKWNGNYNHGNRTVEMPSTKPKIIIEDSVLRKHSPTNLKVYIEGIHPKDIAVACNNGIIKNADNKELFDYTVTPEKTGVIKFFFFINDKGEMIQIGTDSLTVSE